MNKIKSKSKYANYSHLYDFHIIDSFLKKILALGLPKMSLLNHINPSIDAKKADQEKQMFPSVFLTSAGFLNATTVSINISPSGSLANL
jgi:hypothetical protein